MENDFIRVKDIAQKWNVTPRRINQLIADGEISGAYKDGKFWLVPADTMKPDVLRDKKAYKPTSTTKLLPCPVGITSYKEVSQECYYVDKTMLVRDIIDAHSKVYLFTRPRRFGKTLTMDMVRTYFEQTDKDTSEYFINKKIWQLGDEYKEHQGKYPVIFLSFKDAHQPSWDEMYKSLRFTIRNEFLRHIDLLESEELNIYDKKYLRDIMEGKAEFTDYQFALGKLSSMLAAHYGQKTIVIIDEYDTPIQQGHLKGYYDEVVGFMRNLFSAALKDNESLEFGILTGILRVAKESLFSGLNNLVVDTVLDEKYSEYFGFTEDEVADMAAYYGMKHKLTEIKEWYDGYLFGNTEIYNPWSVISYFNNNCKPKAFWSRTSGNEIIGQLIQNADVNMKDNLSNLLQGKEVHVYIDTDIIYPEVNGDSDIIYSFLLVTGYLRVKSVISEFNDNPICSLEIPNREIKSIFQKEIIDSYNGLFAGSIIRNFELSIRTGNAQLFTDTLQKYLMQSASMFDTAYENFYHGTVFGMLAIVSESYYISSNKESGYGRFDIELEPKDKSGLGYIIEFKAGKDMSDEGLASLAKEAIKQIYDKQYFTDMKSHGIKNVGLFGIGFSGKHVVTEYQQISLD
jgi:hypothetical protein